MRSAALLLCLLTLVACGAADRPVQLHAADQPPALLSEWGIFTSSPDALDLNAGVIPYELNAPLFSDYALKLRTVWMPDGSSATYNDAQAFSFPVGTIISKTFYYRKADGWREGEYQVVVSGQDAAPAAALPVALDEHVLIETRLLVRYDERWVAFPYVWNTAQTDASLEIAGDVRRLTLTHGDSQQQLDYVVPDFNQCGGCHTPNHSSAQLLPLGPKSWQLNRPYTWWGDAQSQLAHWSRTGLLADAPDLPLPAPASLQRKAREYLDANCAHCHNPVGAADTSALHLNIDAPADRKLGICKSPVAVGRGSGDRGYDIYPGRPDESIMVYRMQHSDPAIAMPELGRSAVHAEGVALIRAWIANLNGEC